MLINHRCHRATLPEVTLSQTRTIEIYSIDSGKNACSSSYSYSHHTGIIGYEAENIRECLLLARIFLLADAVSLFEFGTHPRQWSNWAILLFNVQLEKKIWKAFQMSMYGEHQAVRLIDPNYHFPTSTMILQGLGVAAQFYHETLGSQSTSEVLEKHTSVIKPPASSVLTTKLFTTGCSLTCFKPNVWPIGNFRKK